MLTINAAIFNVEIGAGLTAGSATLQADAVDFLGDASNYAISLFVIGMALRYRAAAALAKGATMALFGLWGLGVTAWHVFNGTLPQLSRWVTSGSPHLSPMPPPAGCCRGTAWATPTCSVWICTRNDILGNLAVLFAARHLPDRHRVA